jgi:translocation and assembly module TamA
MFQRSLSLAIFLLCSVPAFASIEIDIRGIDEEEIRANVLVYLSFERYRKSDDLSEDTVERLHNRVEREVRAALKPFGYYEPSIHSKLEKRGANDWQVGIDIDPGTPILMETVTIAVSGPGADDPLFAPISANPILRRGDRLSHAAYEKTKGDLQRTAATYGYLDARMLRNELRVDTQAHTASAVLELETGERYRFGATNIEQDAVDERLVRRFVRYKENDPFDLTQLLRTQFALDDSQYFANVDVLPGRPDKNTHIVPVSIRAQVNRRFRYSFGLGYGTDTEERGTATWEDRLVNRRGHRFNVELKAAQIAQSLKGRYVVPIGDPALEKLSFELTAEQRELADLDTRSFDFEPSITQVRGRWQWVWFTTATRTTTELRIDETTDSVLIPGTDTFLIPGVNLASIPQGYLGEVLFTRGFFAELRGSHSVFGSDSDFLQLLVQAERVFDLNPRWHLLLRSEVGGSLVAQFSELPGSVRFFAGGDRSVRGFGYNELSPVETITVTDENGKEVTQSVKVGGKHLLTGTVELMRDLPRNLGVAVFTDFGNAFDRFGDTLEYSAGLGIRWRLPVVTLGIDIAQPLSESGAGPRLHINFSPKL